MSAAHLPNMPPGHAGIHSEAKAQRERADEIVYLIKQALKDGEQLPLA